MLSERPARRDISRALRGPSASLLVASRAHVMRPQRVVRSAMTTNVTAVTNTVKHAAGDDRKRAWNYPAVSTFAERLQWLRKERGVDTRTFGTKAGLSPAFFSGVLQRAKRDPTAGVGSDEAAAIAETWNVSLVWLVTGKGAPEVPPELVIVRDPRYPNLSTAIAFMRGQVKNPEVLETVERRALRSHEDPPPLWWAKKIEALDDDITFEREHPERAAEDEDRADAELRAMEERTTPPIAKQLEAEAEAKKKARKR